MKSRRVPQVGLLAGLLIAGWGALPAGALSGTGSNGHRLPALASPSQAYGRLPLTFEPNVGQAGPAVRFLTHDPGYTLFLTEAGAVLALQAPPAQTHGERLALPRPSSTLGTPRRTLAPRLQPSASVAVQLAFSGANPQPRLEGIERLPGVVSYFIGNDPRQWHTGIPTYARVVYHDVYPGIDQVFYGRGGSLEYDFLVRPGADPSAIHLRVQGAPVRVDGAGGRCRARVAEMLMPSKMPSWPS